jgi:hypothetical protein
MSRIPEEQGRSSERSAAGAGSQPAHQIRVLDHDCTRTATFDLDAPQSVALRRPRKTA